MYEQLRFEIDDLSPHGNLAWGYWALASIRSLFLTAEICASPLGLNASANEDG